ncbi:CaiB/BaiF CoA transferase family protein [Pararoseomonas indoligenes]|uniref:CoA transferase n=1 Tax=Roseomonas indoligenes TaxID=2820811 RepID=A0A940S9N5_9PROT|nr:CoA transferase [Pararoseomonas indoligenes]MBP0495342.1 CoA transferase [Pararoseomonas indoligenes]
MDLLAGIRVVSFNHFLAGPLGAQILADLGADVIALEPPEGAFHRNWAVANHFVGGQSVNFLSTGRNKRSLAVDLKSPGGREVVARLLQGADVVMENFRPGTMEKLGLGYETLRETNPRLIYAAAYGYGSSGPYKDRPGQDLLLQALSGLAARTGRADGPPTPVGAVVVDQHAAMIYAMAILAALFARERTGKGRLVEVNLFQAALDLQTEALTAWVNGARAASPRGPGGIASWFSGGPYGIYATKDGHLALSMSPPGVIGQALEVPELAAMSEGDAFARREDIARLVTERLPQRSTAEWLPGLEKHKVWHAPMQDYEDLQSDPQLQHLGAFITTDGATGHPVTLISHPARYDGEVPRVRLVPQPLGAQSRDILAELGFSPEEMEGMKRDGAVNWPEGPQA